MRCGCEVRICTQVRQVLRVCSDTKGGGGRGGGGFHWSQPDHSVQQGCWSLSGEEELASLMLVQPITWAQLGSSPLKINDGSTLSNG